MTTPITLRCAAADKGWQITVVGDEAGTVTSRRLDGAIAAARPLLERHAGVADVDGLEVALQVVAAPPVAAAVRRAIDARDRAADQQDEASIAMRDAVQVLAAQEISLRDAASMLGLSYERVRQLLDSESAGQASRPGGVAVPIVSTDELP